MYEDLCENEALLLIWYCKNNKKYKIIYIIFIFLYIYLYQFAS